MSARRDDPTARVEVVLPDWAWPSGQWRHPIVEAISETVGDPHSVVPICTTTLTAQARIPCHCGSYAYVRSRDERATATPDATA